MQLSYVWIWVKNNIINNKEEANSTKVVNITFVYANYGLGNLKELIILLKNLRGFYILNSYIVYT